MRIVEERAMVETDPHLKSIAVTHLNESPEMKELGRYVSDNPLNVRECS